MSNYLKLGILLFSLNYLTHSAVYAQCTIRAEGGPVCASRPVTFSVADPDGSLYSWDFDGNGTQDQTGISVTYQFPALSKDVTYTVTLFRNRVVCQTHQITVRATPDAAIGLPVAGGAILDDRVIRICSGVPNVTISMFNNSTTTDITSSYVIDWGDGTTQTLSKTEFSNSKLISHNFRGFGFHPVKVTAKGINTCDNTVEYQVYIGGNPSVGLGNPGNTVGLCAPVTLTFPITGTQNNPAGTEYNIYINGQRVASYTQDNIPSFYTHTFLESSCGQTTSTGNYQNAFDLQIIAANPCGSSTATVEPIEISESPLPLFTILEEATCVGSTVVFKNASEIREVISGSPSRCQSELTASWAITPGTAGRDWFVVEGNLFSSNRLGVDFSSPGQYTITITVSSPSCGSQSYSETITVQGKPKDVGVSLSLDAAGDCAPATVRLFGRGEGEGLQYQWSVSPHFGWKFATGSNSQSREPVVQIEQGGDYGFQLSARNACGVEEWDTTLVFRGRPFVDLFTPADACQSAVLNFDASLVRYDDQGSPITEYYWEFPGAETKTDWQAYPKNVRYATTGTYGYRVAVTNACGTSTAVDTLRVIDPIPVQMPPRKRLCLSGSPVQLDAQPRGGIWSGPGVTAAGRFRPSEAGAGVHTLQYRFGVGNCAVSGSMEVEVLAADPVDAGPNRGACVGGDVLTLTGIPAGGEWKGPGVTGNQFDPVAAKEGTHRLTYTYVNAEGCIATDSTTVKVTLPPQIATQDMVVCDQPGLVNLPPATPQGGVWSGPGVSGGRFDPKAAGGPGEYALTYRYGDPNGCVATQTIKATVVGSASVDAGPDLNLCAQDAPAELSLGAKPAGGRWRASGGGLTGSKFDPSKVQPGQHIVSYEVTIGNCTLTDTKVIWVREAPKIDLGQVPTFICNTEPQVELKATPTGGRWSAGPGAVLEGNLFKAAASGPGTYRLQYEVEGTSGCAARKTVEITVGTLPEVKVRDTVYCSGPDRVALPEAQPQGGRWSGPGVENNYFYAERAGGVGNYRLMYTYSSGGCMASAEAKVEVMAPISVNAGMKDTICLADGRVTLPPAVPEGGRWSGNGIADDRLGIFDPALAGEGAHQLVYTVGRSGCVQRDTVPIMVVGPLPINMGPALEFCPGDTPVTLSDVSPEGGQWSGPGVREGRFFPEEPAPGQHVLQYAVTDAASGCVTLAERKVTVHPRPRMLFPAPATACTGEKIDFGNDSQGAETYRWDFGDGATSALAKPNHTYNQAGTFTIALIGSNTFGCSDTLTRSVSVAQYPAAHFTPDADGGCGPLTVLFTNDNLTPNTRYRWDFGNGEQSGQEQPDPVLFPSGRIDTSYVVTLRVENHCGTDMVSDTILVYPRPQIDFGVAVDTTCSPMLAEFANRTVGIPEYFRWDLGNGKTSTDSLPPPQYYQADTTQRIYTITLIAGNRCGEDTLTKNITVKPLNIRSFFNVPSREGCSPFTVPFTNLATVGAKVHWDFGDGDRSSSVNPVHTFSQPGEYVVWQYADNGCGQDSARQTIRVLPSPTVAFSNPPTACEDAPVYFNNESSGAMGYFWTFGDGDTSRIDSPTHSFREGGTYTVTLVGESVFNGCRAEASRQVVVQGKPSADFTVSDREGCMPLAVDFSNSLPAGYYFDWDFGDGNTAVGAQPRHTYRSAGVFTVRLTVTDTNGCSTDTSAMRVTVHPQPVAAFEVSANELCGLPAPVTLLNQSRGATGYTWNFGDGSVSALTHPGEHRYQAGGRYDIRLIAINTFQCADTLVRSVQVFPPPEARYEIRDRTGCAPLSVTFTNFSSANHYYWDFGDGMGSQEPHPSHTYTRAGRYDVRLVVSFNDICYDTLELRSAVDVFPKPVADFDMVEDGEGPLGSIVMVNRSRDATAWRWSFGDGVVSEEENPRHRYYSNGSKQVLLEVFNQYGCRDDTLRTVDPPFIKGLFVPNAFSPEVGIGEVRLFMPKGAGLKEYRIQVFSPYGQLVWESDKLENGSPAESWDGTMHGQVLPQDVYVWKAYALFEDGTSWRGMPDGRGNYKVIGSVTLLR